MNGTDTLLIIINLKFQRAASPAKCHPVLAEIGSVTIHQATGTVNEAASPRNPLPNLYYLLIFQIILFLSKSAWNICTICVYVLSYIHDQN